MTARKIRVAHNSADREWLLAIGPNSVEPFTVTYRFRCDEPTDAELVGLGDEQRIERLLAARGTRTGGLVEINHGYWGDLHWTLSGEAAPPGTPLWWRIPPKLDAEFNLNWNEEADADTPPGSGEGGQR
jgi:hypothetical protein